MHRTLVRLLLCELSVLAFLFSLFTHYSSAASARTRADGPDVVMVSTKRDFGDVFAGEELEQNFPVRNAGTKPLELSLKSTLGTRSAEPGYPLKAAIWRPSEGLLARTVSARAAAPG